MKAVLYKNPSYCLSFGEDCVFLDIEVEIVRESELRREFSAVVKRMQLDPAQEAFPVFMLNYFSAERISVFYDDLKSRLIAELTPQLFSLFYSSELIPDQNDNTTAE